KLGGKLFPGPRPKGDGLNELPRTAKSVTGLEHVDDHPDALVDRRERRLGVRLVVEQTKHRWLVHDQAAEQLGAFTGEPQGDCGAEGIARDVGRAMADMVNECREIGHVFLNVALSSGSLALTVPPAIVGHHAEGACEPWDNGIPVVMVAPRTVDEDDEIPRPSAK